VLSSFAVQSRMPPELTKGISSPGAFAATAAAGLAATAANIRASILIVLFIFRLLPEIGQVAP
jgi:hypothetical protein